jgi:NADH-quinone oxidoreductase subunit J
MIMGNVTQWILGFVAILSSLGILVVRQPVHASLSFLLTLLSLAALYLQLSAEFIAVMQVLVYAGAILVIFVFVIVLFQDAYQQIEQFKPESSPVLLSAAIAAVALIFALIGSRFIGLTPTRGPLPEDFGTVHPIGQALYVDFFFPFEAIILLFLIALIGAFYIGKKG